MDRTLDQKPETRCREDTLGVYLDVWSWPGSDALQKPLLRDIKLHAEPGVCLCIQGASGSGKSTLLQILAGLIPARTGRVWAPPGDGSRPAIGIVMQNPFTQMLTDTVLEEILFGLEQSGKSGEKYIQVANDLLCLFGLESKKQVAVTDLSMGQQYCLLIACMLALRPRFLLLDEPCAQLDSENTSRLSGILKTLKADGVGIVYTAHYHDDLYDVTDSWLHISEGRLVNGRLPTVQLDVRPLDPPTEDAAITLNNVSFVIGDVTLWQNLNLTVRAGEIVYIYGKNGCGKSTLMRHLAGLPSNVTADGTIRILGKTMRTSAPGRVMYLPQDPAVILFATSVLEEIAFSAKRLPQEGACNAGEVAIGWGLDSLKERPSRLLSYGQQHVLALAAISAHTPDVLLLDDPLSGLDPMYVRTVAENLWCLAAGTSRINGRRERPAVLIAGHDESLTFLAHRSFRYEENTLVPH